MLGAFLFPLACSGSSDIPSDPGAFDDVVSLQRAWLPASPDNLMTALVMRTEFLNFQGDCPAITLNELGLSIDGDCEGESGETWHGSATVRDSEDHMDLFDFGPTWDGITWTLDGELDWTFPDLSEPDEQVIVDVVIAWQEDDLVLEASADLEFLLDWNGGRPQLLWTEGEIGVGDWGTASLTTDIVELGTANSCNWPTSGALVLVGENTGSVAFDDSHCLDECPTGNVDGVSVGDLCLGDGLPRLVMPGDEDTGGTGGLD